MTAVADAQQMWAAGPPTLATVLLTVQVPTEVLAQGWNGDAAELAESIRATLFELQGDDGGAYRPSVTVLHAS